ncbi:hypothetical protein WJX74_001265 [Apatococcus lobatus]|uniref:DNA-(apurinic or apyrimidinic site) endonuclease n=1 Tax=Apatococcus lobatus TaxID=904363 RepID=A0AAW1QCT2_9CHLO
MIASCLGSVGRSSKARRALFLFNRFSCARSGTTSLLSASKPACTREPFGLKLASPTPSLVIRGMSSAAAASSDGTAIGAAQPARGAKSTRPRGRPRKLATQDAAVQGDGSTMTPAQTAKPAPKGRKSGRKATGHQALYHSNKLRQLLVVPSTAPHCHSWALRSLDGLAGHAVILRMAANKPDAKSKSPRKKKSVAKPDPDAVQADAVAEGVGEGVAPAPAPKRRKKAEAPPPAVVYSTDMRPARLQKDQRINIVSWNVCSLPVLLRKDPEALTRLVEAEDVDVICLQETKLQGKATEATEELLGLLGWQCIWSCSTARLGYSGTAIFCRARFKPLLSTYGIGDAELDQEGRTITAEFPGFHLVNVYTPNAGEGLKRLDYRIKQWDVKFAEYVAKLSKTKPVVCCGDLNCAHHPIDIHSPKTNKKSAGFTQEERDSFGTNLLGRGLVDTFRRQYPEIAGYTWWSRRLKCREKNKGWRLDYFLVSEPLMPQVYDCYHLPSVDGSDHCPVGIVLRKGMP